MENKSCRWDYGFADLVDEIITKVDVDRDLREIRFHLGDGKVFKMYHSQDCCESVCIEDINGDWADIVGEKILVADERTSNENPVGVTKEYQESFTYTFYTIRTFKGSVDIRWYGESNGYYSESVDFDLID